jgi:hypothetical protein
MEQKDRDLLIRIDERTENMEKKIDDLCKKQPEQDKQINDNKVKIAINSSKILNSRLIFGIAGSIITIGAIIASALAR